MVRMTMQEESETRMLE